MRVGAIVFDPTSTVRGSDRSVVMLTGGWASIAGTPARRIQGIAELPSDVIWLTNLNSEAMFAARLTMHANFRNDRWLRATFDQMAEEFGLGQNTSRAKETAEVVALVAHRVVAYSCRELNVHIQSHNRLNEDYGAMMGLDRCRVPEMHRAIFDTVASHPTVNVIPPVSYGRSGSNVTAICNRMAYARYMLSQRVPADADWTLVEKPMTDAELEKLDRPFLVRCRITNVKPMIAEALSWGSGAKNVREWLTDVEWRTVRTLAQVEARSALISDHPYQELSQYAAKLPHGSMGELSELSYSLGLVAEQVWTALTNRQPRIGKALGHPARAAWLRAIDRMTMFDYAQRLSSTKGVQIRNYGVGKVILRVPENGLGSVVAALKDVRLMASLGSIKAAVKEAA